MKNDATPEQIEAEKRANEAATAHDKETATLHAEADNRGVTAAWLKDQKDREARKAKE